MGAKTLLSLEEFLALHDDGNKYELSQGELIVNGGGTATMPMASREHVDITWRIATILSEFVNELRLGRVYTEAGYVLSRVPELTYREPDVSFISRERLRAMTEGILLEGSPELAVEVVSPSNTAEELALKKEQYLAAGCKQVWVVYPKARLVEIHKAGGQVSKLFDSDTITSDLFPGWSARVAEFFNLDY